MPKINKKNIKIANFLKRKKQNNEEQIIYRTSDSLSLYNNSSNSTNDDNSNSTNEDKSNSTNEDKSNSTNDNKSNSTNDDNSNSKKKSENESSIINSSSFKTQSIASKSPLIKSTTDSDFINWDIDIISSKIKKISSIDSCSETSECITDETSSKSSNRNSNSNLNWDLMEKKTKKTNNTIKIEKNNISITIDESNNIKIKFI